VCNAVQYQGRWYQTPSELADLLGGPDRIVWDDNEPHDMNSCLCTVNLEKTLMKAGLYWTRGVDPMEWFASNAG
jgi:hypothetical protein